MTLPDSPLAALTEALVDANDRLLGLMGLTELSHASLDETEALEAIANRAISILGLAGMSLTCAPRPNRVWYRDSGAPVRPPDYPRGIERPRWSTTRHIEGHGTMQLIAWRSHQRFDTGDAKLLEAVGNIMAAAIRAARQHEKELAQALIASEHEAAARLTTAALGSVELLPSFPGLSLHVVASPARTTGGDLWICSANEDSLWFAVGDVSGKGLPAAVLMSTVVTATKAAIDRFGYQGVGRAIEALGQWVHEPLAQAGLFTTMALARWSPTTGFEIANAGHSPVVHARNGSATRIPATAPPLGVIETMIPSVQTVPSQPGDLLLLATDGMSEQRNPKGEMFGEDHFDALVAEHSRKPDARAIGTAIAGAVELFSADADQDDDRTLMSIRVAT